MVRNSIPLIHQSINLVDYKVGTEDIKHAKTGYLLNRFANKRSFVWVEILFGALLSTQGEEDLLKLNPFIDVDTLRDVFNLVSIIMLRANRLGHTNRAIGVVIGLESLLKKVLAIPLERRQAEGATLIPKLMQIGEELSKTIRMGRHYISYKSASKTFNFDPRFLVFEFVWNIQLRKKQVDIINDFRDSLSNNRSKVKQMIMGAGKTSVVAPLLALILADGKSLVLSVVPKALVEMSRTRLRETFAAIMVKRIYTLDFDRSTVVKPSMRKSLENATANRGVVVATPTALKNVLLSYVEVLQNLKEAHANGFKTKINELKPQAEELAKILSIFRDGIMLLDEVDLILHPLKSELNFPIGEKFDLDGSEEGERWSLPIHLLDAIFYTSTNRVSSFEQRGVALDILKKISVEVQRGIAYRHLQRLSHITLLNVDFYKTSIKPLMAEWAYLWLQQQHLHGIEHHEAVQYMLEGAAARSETSLKVNLIDVAINKTLVTSGEKSPVPPLTKAYEKLLSVEELNTKHSTVEKLRRQGIFIKKK